MARIAIPQSVAEWNQRGRNYLPGHLGIDFLAVEPDEVRARMRVERSVCVAKPAHKGRTTQVWDAEVRAEKTGKTIAHFRCTQMILRKKD